MKTWRVKKGFDIRIRSGHPWVFSNELLESPKGIQPGEHVELQDIKGNFLARGYGNPLSLIAFRALSFESHVADPFSVESIVNKLFKSWKNRHLMGFHTSFRICFSEADFLPGFILDRYLIEKNGEYYQVFSFQILTAGMNKIFEKGEEIFRSLVELAVKNKFTDLGWDKTLLLSHNDSNVRKLEGLEVEVAQVLKSVGDVDLSESEILIQSVSHPNENIRFCTNLIEGQKTGFFLDQTHNIKLLVDALKPRLEQFKDKPVRIIDLCCYMGQWSAQIVHFLQKNNIKAEVDLVDVSELALNRARKNLEKFSGVKIRHHKKDVLEGLISFPENSYDVVISDPPAFVKNKRDLETGLHGYMKLNQQAYRIADHNSLVISCTCSGLVQMAAFTQSLRKAIVRSGKKAKIVCEGGLGWDHPQLLQFPEGRYLKMIMCSVE